MTQWVMVVSIVSLAFRWFQVVYKVKKYFSVKSMLLTPVALCWNSLAEKSVKNF